VAPACDTAIRARTRDVHEVVGDRDRSVPCRPPSNVETVIPVMDQSVPPPCPPTITQWDSSQQLTACATSF
jgi:hypothetical protein